LVCIICFLLSLFAWLVPQTEMANKNAQGRKQQVHFDKEDKVL